MTILECSGHAVRTSWGIFPFRSKLMPIPMATVEGTLVASTSRGCKALGGVITVLTQDGMTCGPAIEFPFIIQAALWVDSPAGSTVLHDAFDSTTRFARFQKLKCTLAERTLYVRLRRRRVMLWV